MSAVLHAALKFAVKAHRKADRDGADPLPYVTHSMDVVNRLRYVGLVCDEHVLVAGMLHDVLEETTVKPPQIFEEFGGEVLDLVLEMTRQEPELSTHDLAPEEIWHIRSMALLEEVGRMSPEAQSIKLADRTSNVVAASASREGDKLNRYLEQSRWILERIPESVNPRLWHGLSVLLARNA